MTSEAMHDATNKNVPTHEHKILLNIENFISSVSEFSLQF
jgi:hypothetical protein